MHLIIEGKKWEERLEKEPVREETNTNGANAALQNYNSFFYTPKTIMKEVSYKITVDSSDLTLLESNYEYRAFIKPLNFSLIITEENYKKYLKILNKINMEDALLLNELAHKKGKLEDVWSKQGVNVLLGISVND